MRGGGRALVAAPPLVWLGALFLLPFLIVAKISLSTRVTAQPPYEPVFDWTAGWEQALDRARQFSFDSYATLFADPTLDPLYADAALSSLRLALIGTVLTALIGYPLALAIARSPPAQRPALLLLAVLPFWTSFLIRVYAWIAILKMDGFLNQILLATGLVREPLVILHTEWAVLIGLVYAYLPFMILPLYAAIEGQSRDLLEAAADLGCRPFAAFRTVTLPLSQPGLLAGCLLVFIPMTGEYVIPDLLGGPDTTMIGTVLWDAFFRNRDWPLASAIAIVLTAFLLFPLWLARRAFSDARAS